MKDKVFVARQPIFSTSGQLFGYELLYRGSSENSYTSGMDGSKATCEVLSRAAVTFGLNNLTKGRFALINFPKDLLLSQLPTLLSPKELIIEILEDTAVDEPLLERLRELKEFGYTLALDDFDGKPGYDSLIALVDIIKVDFRLTNPARRGEIAEKYRDTKQLLAEKVESKGEFEQAQRDGYVLFQGYYFSKPVVLSHRAVDIMSVSYLRLWRELAGEVADIDRLTDIIQTDVNLSYKFLRRINTLRFYQSNRVHSIKQAVVRMGQKEMRRWLMLLLLRDVMGNNLDEAVRVALVRGTFAEKLAGRIGLSYSADEAYMVGLFSMMPAILNQNMGDVLEGIDISEDVRAALSGWPGRLLDLLNFIIAYECGDWDKTIPFLKRYPLSPERVTELYTAAVQYADQAFEDTTDQPSEDPS